MSGSLPVEQTMLLEALRLTLSWPVEEAVMFLLLLHQLLMSCWINYLQQMQYLYFLHVVEIKAEDNRLLLCIII